MICQCQSKAEVTGLAQRDVKKTYKLDLEVKGQHRFGITNVRYTSSHGDAPMYQIWNAYVKANKRHMDHIANLRHISYLKKH